MKNLKYVFGVILTSLFFTNYMYASNTIIRMSTNTEECSYAASEINHFNIDASAKESTIYKIVMAAMFGPERKKVKIFNQ